MGRKLLFHMEILMGFLDGKKILILGIANDKSIAWSIAEAMKKEGAELAFTFAGEAFEKRVKPLADSIGVDFLIPCDVTDDSQIDSLFEKIKDRWGNLDSVIHSIAFANKEELKGEFIDTTREGFRMAMDVSAYSFVAVAQRAVPLMKDGGSLMAMTYYGSVKVIPNYYVMGVAKAALEACTRYLAANLGEKGIRVNAISAGPIKTLASAGISGMRELLRIVGSKAPLRRNVTQEDVAKAAVYLASDLASGVTGEIHYVDCGYNIIGV